MSMFLLGMLAMYVIVGIILAIYDIVDPGEFPDLFMYAFMGWIILLFKLIATPIVFIITKIKKRG